MILPNPLSTAPAFRDWPLAFRFSQQHPRFCSCSYIPEQRGQITTLEDALVVAIHGSDREAMALRDALIPFAQTTGCAVLAPLFPVSPFGDNNGDGYKRLIEGDLRYDQILLDMIDELAQRSGRNFGRVFLFGFSGGAQFAHRFLYLHPARLAAISIAAPGGVTLLDDAPLWEGLAGWAPLFGAQPELAALAQVKIQLLVGSEDTQKLGVSGRTRREQQQRLAHSLTASGAKPEQHIIPGVAHDGLPLLAASIPFFAAQLQAQPAPNVSKTA